MILPKLHLADTFLNLVKIDVGLIISTRSILINLERPIYMSESAFSFFSLDYLFNWGVM